MAAQGQPAVGSRETGGRGSTPVRHRAATPPRALIQPVGIVSARRSTRRMPDPASLPMWNGWGNDRSNTRFQDAKAAGLTAADVPKLTLKWAFAFRRRNVGVGAADRRRGTSLRRQRERQSCTRSIAKTGCTYWTFKADGGVRTAIASARITGPARAHAVMFGDVRANVYALDAQTGAQLWKIKVEITRSPASRVRRRLPTAALYVPVSSIEEVAGAHGRTIRAAPSAAAWWRSMRPPVSRSGRPT